MFIQGKRCLSLPASALNFAREEQSNVPWGCNLCRRGAFLSQREHSTCFPLAQSPYLPLGVGEILDFERLCIHFLQGTCPIANTGGPSTKKYYPVLETHIKVKNTLRRYQRSCRANPSNLSWYCLWLHTNTIIM